MIKIKTAKKITAVISNLSLLLNSFLPFLLVAQPVRAQSVDEPTPTSIVESTPTLAPENPIADATPTETPSPTQTPTQIPTVEPTSAPTSTPTSTPTSAPTESPNPSITPQPEKTVTPTTAPVNEKICLTNEQLRDSSSEEWVTNDTTGISQTKDKVQLGVKYIFPQENNVTVTFKCLPKDESQRTSLKIQKIKSSELNLPEGINNIGEYAYDITTDMVDGTFEYDITLPKPNNSTGEISYIEKTVEQAKANLDLNDINKIDNSKIEQQNESVKANSVDHFTIFIVSATLTTATLNNQTQVTVHPNESITATLNVDLNLLSGWKYSEWKIGNGSWNYADTPDHLSGLLTDHLSESFNITAPNTIGTYDVSFRVCPFNPKNKCEEITLSNGIIVKPFTGTLIVKKHVVNNDGGTKNASNFTLNIGNTSFSGSESGTVFTLPVGSYSVNENSSIGYSQVGNNCSSVVLSAGETKTCTITNDDIAPRLTLVKSWTDTYNSNYTPNSWTLSAIGAGSSLVGQGQISGFVSVGTYTLSESGPAGTNSSNWDCTGGAVLSNGNKLTLSLGQDVTCTITNTPIQPKLTVIKKVVGSDEPVSNFPLFVNTTSVISGQENGFNVGNYTVSETSNSNYTATFSGNCNSYGQVSLALGDNETCTITNTRKTGTIRVFKNVDLNADGDFNDSGETNANGWKWKINGQEYDAGSSAVTLPTGDYTLSEIDKPNFHFKNLTCTGGNLEGKNITVENGANIICTFENVADTGSVLAHSFNDKNASNSQDLGEDNLAGWNMSLYSGSSCQDSNLISSGITDSSGNFVFNNLVVGNYSVKETSKTGWKTISNTCQNISVIRDNQTVTNFGNQELGKVTVYKFNDLNGNGIHDSGEPYLSDWTMNLTDQVSLDTSTNGSATFNNLNPNTNLTLSENNKEGWYQSGITCDGAGTLITTPGEAYGHHGACSGWNGYDAVTLAQWACETKGFRYLVSYGADKPCTQFRTCNLFYGGHGQGVQMDWGNGCNVQGVTDIVCSNSVSSGGTSTPDIGYSATNQNYQLTVAPGATRTCYVGNYQKASVTVYKFNDLDGDGYRGEDEPFMSDWNINLNNQKLKTNSNGQVIFGQLTPNTYNLSEDLKYGWEQTNIICDGEEATDKENSHRVTLTSGQNKTCYIGNKFIPPKATISKTNNASNDLKPGDSVQYNIKISILDNDLNSFQVTDLLSEGFNYRVGSYKIYKNIGGIKTDVTNSIMPTDPTYHSPGVWTLGDLKAGDQLELIYTADISTNQQAGKYTDLAYASGKNTYTSETVLAQANNDGKINDNFVGTQVPISRSNQNSASVGVEKEQTTTGSVLGASTELPSTGASTIWLLISALMSLIGLIIIKNAKISTKMSRKTLLPILLGFLIANLFSSPAMATIQNTTIRVEDPKSPVNSKDIQLKFVALDIQNKPIIVQCFKKYQSDSSFSQFGNNITLTNGGNASYCDLSLAINNSGDYQFYVVAISSDTVQSSTVSLTYKNQNPDTPYDYRKEKINNCDYKIHFKTGNDSGRTTKVEIYRADITSFTADDGSKIAGINIGSDKEYDLTNGVPDCSKEYYYAVRAFDDAGNGSNLIGDSITKNTIVNIGSTESNNINAIPATGSNIPKEKSDIKSENENESGTILGSQDTSSKSATVKFQSFISRHKIFSALLAIILLAIIGYGIKKIPQKKKK